MQAKSSDIIRFLKCSQVYFDDGFKIPKINEWLSHHTSHAKFISLKIWLSHTAFF